MTRVKLTEAIKGLTMCTMIGLFFSACSTADNRPANTNATNTTSTTTTNNRNTGTTTTTSTSGQPIGVTECDEFIARYEECINNNVPESARASVRTQLDAMRTSWRYAASTPQGRAGLAQGCRAAQESARQQMTQYNCRW